jgi:hypothetical protein
MPSHGLEAKTSFQAGWMAGYSGKCATERPQGSRLATVIWLEGYDSGRQQRRADVLAGTHPFMCALERIHYRKPKMLVTRRARRSAAKRIDMGLPH